MGAPMEARQDPASRRAVRFWATVASAVGVGGLHSLSLRMWQSLCGPQRGRFGKLGPEQTHSLRDFQFCAMIHRKPAGAENSWETAVTTCLGKAMNAQVQRRCDAI